LPSAPPSDFASGVDEEPESKYPRFLWVFFDIKLSFSVPIEGMIFESSARSFLPKMTCVYSTVSIFLPSSRLDIHEILSFPRKWKGRKRIYSTSISRKNVEKSSNYF